MHAVAVDAGALNAHLAEMQADAEPRVFGKLARKPRLAAGLLDANAGENCRIGIRELAEQLVADGIDDPAAGRFHDAPREVDGHPDDGPAAFVAEIVEEPRAVDDVDEQHAAFHARRIVGLLSGRGGHNARHDRKRACHLQRNLANAAVVPCVKLITINHSSRTGSFAGEPPAARTAVAMRRRWASMASSFESSASRFARNRRPDSTENSPHSSIA